MRLINLLAPASALLGSSIHAKELDLSTRDKTLQFQLDTTIKASHGMGYHSRYATLKP